MTEYEKKKVQYAIGVLNECISFVEQLQAATTRATDSGRALNSELLTAILVNGQSYLRSDLRTAKSTLEQVLMGDEVEAMLQNLKTLSG